MDCPTKQSFYGKFILNSLNPHVCSLVYSFDVYLPRQLSGCQGGPRRERLDGCGYSLLMFHTYKKLASLAVATLRPALRVARFSAERTFSFDSANSASGILMAEPAFKPSRSLRTVATIRWCFPFRPCGTSARTTVLKCIGVISA